MQLKLYLNCVLKYDKRDTNAFKSQWVAAITVYNSQSNFLWSSFTFEFPKSDDFLAIDSIHFTKF